MSPFLYVVYSNSSLQSSKLSTSNVFSKGKETVYRLADEVVIMNVYVEILYFTSLEFFSCSDQRGRRGAQLEVDEWMMIRFVSHKKSSLKVWTNQQQQKKISVSRMCSVHNQQQQKHKSIIDSRICNQQQQQERKLDSPPSIGSAGHPSLAMACIPNFPFHVPIITTTEYVIRSYL